jgi:hypothetical protein
MRSPSCAIPLMAPRKRKPHEKIRKFGVRPYKSRARDKCKAPSALITADLRSERFSFRNPVSRRDFYASRILVFSYSRCSCGVSSSESESPGIFLCLTGNDGVGVHFGKSSARPILYIEKASSHPLAVEQRHGISGSKYHEILRAIGAET